MKLLSILLFLIYSNVYAMPEGLPLNSYQYIPILKTELYNYWNEFNSGSYIAAQIEQETCISLTHNSCWNPYAELKTSREYGFGLGQITITEKFNKFTELKSIHSSLKNWEWVDRFDATRQLRSIVLSDKLLYKQVGWTDSPYNRIAFMLSAYNGGLGGLLNDKKLCDSNVGYCDSRYWFNNIEFHSWKNKVKLPGYGKSFFDINREYVRNIFSFRSQKYRFLDDNTS